MMVFRLPGAGLYSFATGVINYSSETATSKGAWSHPGPQMRHRAEGKLLLWGDGKMGEGRGSPLATTLPPRQKGGPEVMGLAEWPVGMLWVPQPCPLPQL